MSPSVLTSHVPRRRLESLTLGSSLVAPVSPCVSSKRSRGPTFLRRPLPRIKAQNVIQFPPLSHSLKHAATSASKRVVYFLSSNPSSWPKHSNPPIIIKAPPSNPPTFHYNLASPPSPYLFGNDDSPEIPSPVSHFCTNYIPFVAHTLPWLASRPSGFYEHCLSIIIDFPPKCSCQTPSTHTILPVPLTFAYRLLFEQAYPHIIFPALAPPVFSRPSALIFLCTRTPHTHTHHYACSTRNK